MAELKLISKHPDSLKQIIQSALSERLHSIEAGIKRTKERLQQFETKYQLSTDEFIQCFNNDVLSHSFDFDEWIGESQMLKHLQEKKKKLRRLSLLIEDYFQQTYDLIQFSKIAELINLNCETRGY